MEKLQKNKYFGASTILVLMVKGTKLVKLFKVMMLMKFSKVFITLFSMMLSVFIYSFSMGPWFALGFVLMIFIHEMGHVIALVRKGYPVSAPIFIPMLGAFIFAPKFKNLEEEAYVGYGGPLLGGLGALVLFGLWAVMPGQHEVLLFVSYSATFINLFNMVPIRPLDGGRITHIVGDWFIWAALVVLLGLSLYIRQPSILLVWILVINDFTVISPLKFGMSLVCWISMLTFMLLGYGEQPIWANVFDLVMGAVCVWVEYLKMSDIPEEENEQVPVPMNLRMKWVSLYVLLLVSLGAFMAFQATYLPRHLQK